jgi:hypothetical protein
MTTSPRPPFVCYGGKSLAGRIPALLPAHARLNDRVVQPGGGGEACDRGVQAGTVA